MSRTPSAPLVARLVARLAACLALLATAPYTQAGAVHRAAAPIVTDPLVLLISVDALNPSALTTLGAQRTPNFHRLLREGAGTLNARTLVERTETLPNHASMLTGRRVRLPRGMNVTFNTDPGTTLRKTAGHYIAGIFDVVHDHGGTTSMYVAKSKFRYLDRSWNGDHGARDRVGVDNGRDKIDRFVYAEASEGTLVRRLNRRLGAAPSTFTFLHLAAPDRAGHKYGGMSRQYLDAVQRTDALLGRVLATIDRTPGLRDRLTVILTSDHGTRAFRHDDPTRRVNYRVPFVGWGAGVQQGTNLYALNPTYANPGRTRPGYSGAQPVRNGDAANLAASLLGLPAVRGSEMGALTPLDLG